MSDKIEPKEGRLLKVEDHSQGIYCPHCGEEFGIESEIEYAHQAQDAKTAAEKDREHKAAVEGIFREIEKIFPWIYQGVNTEPWEALKQKYLV